MCCAFIFTCVMAMISWQVGRQVYFAIKKYLQIRRELKIYKYTKNIKKQINTKLMAGMRQKELKQPYWTSGLGRKSPIKQDSSVRPSVRPSVCSQVFSELAYQFFLKLSMVLGAHIQLCVTAGFFRKETHQAKMTKNGQKWSQNRVLDFLRKSCHQFFLEFV